MRLRYALPAAAVGGYLLDVASPSLSVWPASLIGTALILVALWNQRARTGLLLGAIAGAAFWGPHIFWLTLYLGPVPWAGLTGLMVVWFALFGAAVGFTTNALSRSVLLQALAVAGLWVVREQVQGAWPYGGFAWGRLAHMQAEGPLAQSVSWVGFAGLSGLIAFAAALPVAAIMSDRLRQGALATPTPSGALRALPDPASRGVTSAPPPPLRFSVGATVFSLALLCILAIVPPAPLGETGILRVAAVQGNSKSGIFDDRDSGDVLNDHLEATEQLLDELEADGDRVDVIVWPENSGEFDLLSNALGKQAIAKLSGRAGAPIVAGTVVAEDGEYFNSSIVMRDDGPTGERYDKRYPVPFAEYMPNRSLWRTFAPDLVDLVQLEYSAGTRSAVIDLDTPAGPVRAGVAICFDIIFDGQAVAMVDDGAEVILAQTNNADFGRTDESAQQLSIARLRAIETGRAVVNVSTVGTSAIVAGDGSDLDRLPTHTAGAMVADVALVEGETPALRLGSLIAGTWTALGLAGLGFAGWTTLRSRRLGARAEA